MLSKFGSPHFFALARVTFPFIPFCAFYSKTLSSSHFPLLSPLLLSQHDEQEPKKLRNEEISPGLTGPGRATFPSAA